jgi:hypothetical protein
MARRRYAVHRWLGAVIGLQLFLWSLGGFIFATHDIAWVRGDEGRNLDAEGALPLAQVAVTPAQAASGLEAVETVVLRPMLGRPVYEVRHAGGIALIDAEDGSLRSPIDEATAVAIARADRLGQPSVRAVRRLTEDPPTEYRGQPLPAWRVDLDDGEGTSIYVAAASGRITARRNDAWRRFDFFWMLHTMDYRGRDDFNHLLLIVFAALGLVTVGSGWLLWFGRLHRRWKRRRRAGDGGGEATATTAPAPRRP